MLNKLLIILLLSFLPACHGVDDLDRTKIEGQGFNQDLAARYRKFADREARDYDWIDAEHFAQKGLKLAKGADVEPEQPQDWAVPAATLEQLQVARGQLMELLLNPQVKDKFYELAASAQFYYDCWIEEQEENWQTERIANCR